MTKVTQFNTTLTHFAFRNLICFVSLFYSSLTFAISPKACFMEAIDEIEKAYCEIVAEGYGAQLPDLYSFRQNTAQTQLLLLQRPAQKAGISLPQTPPAATTEATEKPAIKNSTSEKSQQQAAQVPSAQKQPESTTKLQECQLYREHIKCRDNDYYLVVNLPLSRLDQSALTHANQLQFESRTTSDTHIQYLSSLYPEYIRKMLMIGLGDSTLSFTKFFALYENTGNDDRAFARRFHQMYELLKEERRSNAVKQRYQNNFPEAIDNCMRVSPTLIACDNVNQNWVYQRGVIGAEK